MTEPGTCTSCRLPKATEPCGVCDEGVCRKCVQTTSDETFQFETEVAEILKKPRYCTRCWDEHVAEALNRYEEIVTRARQVAWLPKGYRVPVPVLRKANREARVEGCADRDEVIMKLAFIAARDDYNALVKGETQSKKVRNEGWQTSSWSGWATPAYVDPRRLGEAEELEEIYRIGN